MSKKLRDAKVLIEAYNEHYNTHFELHEIYKLYPTEGEYGFTEPWPCGDNGGVYLIIDENQTVIYVGQTKAFGRRFYQYFAMVDDRCVLRSPNWRGNPDAIVVIPIADAVAYERLSLEEYLILNLNPIDNTLGKSYLGFVCEE